MKYGTVRSASRLLWLVMIFLALVGVAAVVRRAVVVSPIVLQGYRPPVSAANSRLAQLRAIDDVFARHPRLTLIHILPAMLFMILGPLQFSAAIRARYPRWHR